MKAALLALLIVSPAFAGDSSGFDPAAIDQCLEAAQTQGARADCADAGMQAELLPEIQLRQGQLMRGGVMMRHVNLPPAKAGKSVRKWDGWHGRWQKPSVRLASREKAG